MASDAQDGLPETQRRLSRRQLLRNGSLAVAAAGVSGSAMASATVGNRRRVYQVRQVENVWITLSDGVRLAARLWLPVARNAKVPAIWNYSPYHKNGFTRLGDDTIYPYYAAHGYACLRVDIRGSGDSEGRPMDEYVRQEQDDAVEVIKWIAEQPWCSGKVGMEGLSWSGFNSLQVAARRPPELKAIITHCASDDRYADDAHFKGGCILHDKFNWGTMFWTYQGQPSDPLVTGEAGWRERWLERLNAVELNIGNWLQHQRRDAFWKQGSVSEDYDRIACPVYAIGGWVDGYKNAVFRLLEHLKVPAKGLVGPWTHTYPHTGVPGPAIGYLDEALRWWDHWLRGIDTGIMDEPKLRVWMQDKTASERMTEAPGRWVGEPAWPSNRVQDRTMFLNAGGDLSDRAGSPSEIVLQPLQTVGLNSGNWCPSGGTSPDDMPIELAQDQRTDDAYSMLFDTPPLTSDFDILGSPSITVDVTVDRPVAYLIVRLNEVAPTGESNRVTYGILNLTHRDSDEFPTPLVPGQRYRVKVGMDYIAHRFSAGSRVRVSISTSYWPMILPSPEPVVLRLVAGTSLLSLPVRPAQASDGALKPFGKAYVPPVEAPTTDAKGGYRIVEQDVGTGRQTIRHYGARGRTLIPATNTEMFGNNDITYDIVKDDSTSAVLEQRCMSGRARGAWQPRIESVARISLTKDEFILFGQMKAFYGEEVVFSREWNRKFSRDLV